MDCKDIRFGDIYGPKPYKFIGFGDIYGPKPYEFIGFGDIHGPRKLKYKCYLFLMFGRFSANVGPRNVPNGPGLKNATYINGD